MAEYTSWNTMEDAAYEAYKYGEKPKSKWTKGVLLARLLELDRFYGCENFLKKYNLDVLKKVFLVHSGSYRTGAKMKRTSFYRLNMNFIEKNSLADMKARLEKEKSQMSSTSNRKTNHEDDGREIYGEFEVWEGNFKIPVFKGMITLYGKKQGNFLVLENGRKKSLTAKGCHEWNFLS